MTTVDGAINISLEQCISGENHCGIPIVHPMVAISSFGKDLYQFSASTITIGASYMFLANKSRSKTTNDTGSTSERGSFLDRLPIGSSMIKMLNMSAIDMMIGALKNVFLLLLGLGIFMGYILPLIPFFAFFLIILTWFVMVIELMVVAMIWVAFLFQPKNQGENREAHQAFYNSLMQLLLRPLFSVIALILAWSMFAIVIMIVNLTIGSIFGTVTDGAVSFYELVDLAFIITTYCLILYIVTQLVFKLMTIIPTKLFAVINVQEQSIDAENVTSSIKQTVENIITFRIVTNIADDYKRSDDYEYLYNKKMERKQKEQEKERELYRKKVKSVDNKDDE
jgi:conjugal transfer/type IV secretion protein DotA/TraY